MKCAQCGKREGTIRFTEYEAGGKRRSLLCPECATELGFGATPRPDPPPPGAILGVVSLKAALSGEEPAGAEDPRRCPGCGLTGAELEKRSRFGCPRCYETFEDSLDPLFKRLHGAVAHRGRLPRGVEAPASDAERLRRELDEAVESGDYDRAARLRDRLRGGRGAEEDPA